MPNMYDVKKIISMLQERAKEDNLISEDEIKELVDRCFVRYESSLSPTR